MAIDTTLVLITPKEITVDCLLRSGYVFMIPRKLQLVVRFGKPLLSWITKLSGIESDAVRIFIQLSLSFHPSFWNEQKKLAHTFLRISSFINLLQVKHKNYPLTFCLVCNSLDLHRTWPTMLETCWSEKPENLIRFSFAENDWSNVYACLIQFTKPVIPLSFCGTSSDHVATLFCWWTVRFTSVPCTIAT